MSKFNQCSGCSTPADCELDGRCRELAAAFAQRTLVAVRGANESLKARGAGFRIELGPSLPCSGCQKPELCRAEKACAGGVIAGLDAEGLPPS